MIVSAGVLIMFLVLAAIFSRGRGAWLISGYNTLPKKEKEKYDRPALCRFMAKFMLALAFCWVPVVIFSAGGPKVLLIAGIAAFCLVTAVCLVYANTGNRFKK